MPSDNPAIALPRAAARPTIHYRRAADRRSRARWYDAVAELVILQASTRNGRGVARKPSRGRYRRGLQAIVDLDLDELDRRRATAGLRSRL